MLIANDTIAMGKASIATSANLSIGGALGEGRLQHTLMQAVLHQSYIQ